MARAKSRRIKLQEFMEKGAGRDDLSPNPFADLLNVVEFDDDEEMTVLPWGALSREFMDKYVAVFDAELPTDASAEAIRNSDNEKRWVVAQRQARLVLDWTLKDAEGNPLPKPHDNPPAFLELPRDVERALDQIVFFAFDDMKAKLEAVGEDNGSSPLSEAKEAITS